jgi:cobalamin biosynthesis protein CobD/CbiB
MLLFSLLILFGEEAHETIALLRDEARHPLDTVQCQHTVVDVIHKVAHTLGDNQSGFVVMHCYFLRMQSSWLVCYPLTSYLSLLTSILIFYCLAGTTLIREVREVFHAVDRSLDEGRKQVARIVGRDTSELSAQEVRTAALETLAENLSDGVIAPLFWLAIGGVPAMMAYKMVNTLDSMIGYRTERYKDFGCWAAHIDDVANYIPARITALLMIISEELRVKSEE